MKQKIMAPSAFLAGTALISFASPAWAQSVAEPAEEETGQEETSVPNESEARAIVVTGSRIRGAQVIGEVTAIDRESIVEAGQIDLGEAIRALPQNFSGGQNPGVGSGAGLINSNVNSASSANLRGLGPDATLTLLNGHRLPYNSAFQGVDISAIPLAAVDRIEVVPDGASALYGSDAVGGVVNVILRRDFDGVTTSAQIGASTDGGNFRQQADIVGGTTWDRGGFLVAYDFARNSAIRARQRSYASSLEPETTLYPSTQRHAVTLSAHHDLSPNAEVSIDALYSRRDSETVGGTSALRLVREPDLEGFAVAPSVEIGIGERWQATMGGVFGRDRTRFRTRFLPQAGPERVSSGRYKNEVTTLDLGLEGPIFALPGGDVRLAVGGGIRNNRLDFALQNGSLDTEFDVSRRARFGYAELFLPFVSGRSEIGGIHDLSASLAMRYEDYSGLDDQATPRIGLSYSPWAGFELRGSWARSFKAPTLYQQFIFYEAILLPAAALGAGSGADSILFAAGGNPDVGAERAESWTAGIEFKPLSIPELTFSATWFDIAYDDRVVSPISGSLASALQDPGYADLIEFAPSSTRLDQLIDGAQGGLQNFSGSPFDPANVVALIDNRNINVAAWKIQGVDARLAWQRDLGSDRSLALDIAGTWLDSTQQIAFELPEVQLSGTVFNPPRWKGRGTARYRAGNLTANIALDYTGELVDRRGNDERRLPPSATIDLGVTYAVIPGEAREPELELSLTVQNLLDNEPERILQTGPTDFPYDSTNYSAIGRFIAFGIRRHW
ncbi:MAG: TonB-dependent receptor plug domain-containing protein [Qipengyuania pacifica]|jgi:iron complex outermembrane recepter protein|tara:strand:+ start:6381 stop:8735 length:2355 start_codon:yes stop_codon:yes gene_type:complete